MPRRPLRRDTLASQIAMAIRDEIGARKWIEWLPAERSLMQMFNVSRGTLREGLKRLLASGELIVVPKSGYRVALRRRQPSNRARVGVPQLVLICPEQIYSMPAYVVQLVDIVRSMAARTGMPVEVLEGRRFVRADPGRYMPALLRSYPRACWIPIMAGRQLQAWFAKRGAPAVVYGNVYPDIPLAGVGIDYHACLRHATSLLLTRGHRRIALVTHDTRRAGDLESLKGFHEAFEAHRGADVSPFVLSRPDDDARALCKQIDRTMDMGRPPTAFIACRTHHYGTIATRLLETGHRIPADVSLLCRGEDVFLRFLTPCPARYRVSMEVLARRLFRCVLQRIEDGPGGEQHRIVPEFVPGATVAAITAKERT